MKEAKQYNAYSEDLQVLVQALPEKNQSPQIDSPLPRIHQIFNMKETPATAVGKSILDPICTRTRGCLFGEKSRPGFRWKTKCLSNMDTFLRSIEREVPGSFSGISRAMFP